MGYQYLVGGPVRKIVISTKQVYTFNFYFERIDTMHKVNRYLRIHVKAFVLAYTIYITYQNYVIIFVWQYFYTC